MESAHISATDPQASIWVAASAGTGKTKILTDRVLALLLHGFAPERILCLTFTKAAASEMASRITQRLAKWAALAPADLYQELEGLLGIVPSVSHLSSAHHLFAIALDSPGGMKIQTIHGFCQSILGRFPLETGISPHFHVLDETESKEIWEAARQAIFLKSSPIADKAFAILSSVMGDSHFSAILEDFYHCRRRIHKILSAHDSLEGFGRALLQFLEAGQYVDSVGGCVEACLDPELVARLKRQFIPVETGTEADFDNYIGTFLTREGEIRKKIPQSQVPEAKRIYQFTQSLKALETARRTLAFLILYQEMLAVYEEQKARRCALDYEDLIHKTQSLLSQPDVASWILYKLDGGIDHLLVDEAQDTNAAQWEIILSLTADFFTLEKPCRTIFVVGDAKQSIYSFQGADPHTFLTLKNHFSNLCRPAGQKWREIQMDVSYRSTSAILDIVDEVFSSSENSQGVSFEEQPVFHKAFRAGHPGLVEIWPLIEPPAEALKNFNGNPDGKWPLPAERIERTSAATLLARHIAQQVAGWMASKEILPSMGRPVQPRDILILVRKRSGLGEEIIRALKKHSIPIAGADRLVLNDHIAIMDLLALGQFVLLPEDDLNLACLLRSPLLSLSEENLFALAQGRDGTLWASLSQKSVGMPEFANAYAWLKACLYEADLRPVYEFYSWVLNQGEGKTRLLSRLGNEIDEVIEEFLNQGLIYGQSHTGSLQGFIHFMGTQMQEIKRDTASTAQNQVRLMTVHGAKGLQAPIVILPDTTASGKGKRDCLLWGDNLFMVQPAQKHDTSATQYLKGKSSSAGEEEHRRLLYVGLTRAQDRLYIGGCPEKNMPSGCWRQLVKEAVVAKGGEDAMQYTNGHALPSQNPLADAVMENGDFPLPTWMRQPPVGAGKSMEGQPAEKEFLTPVRLQSMDRGTLIHRFFDYLPSLPEDQRILAARQMVKEMLAQRGESKKELTDQWEKDIRATLQILDNPVFGEIFETDAFKSILTEAPVIGFIEGAPFSGRIDRLVITSDKVIVIDYKTGRNPPETREGIPTSYLQQLENYETVLKSIYPAHKIQKMILWTEGPSLQSV